MRLNFHNHQMNLWFFVFIFLFGYAQSIQMRIMVRDQINLYSFTPEGAVFTFFTACVLFIIMNKLLHHYQTGAQKMNVVTGVKVFGISILLFLLLINLLSFTVSLTFGNLERNFNTDTLLRNTMNTVLDAFIYGSFFLAYSFHQKNRKYNQQLATYNEALSNSKIAQLKTQLNPHFLFNNLNVLDQLIEEDKEKASEFLNDFAELYRYVLQTSDTKLVPLEEELSFVKSYFNLIEQKYGKAYKLELKEKHKTKGFIPPLSLQLLLENAIEHNAGEENNPVIIRIVIGEKLIVSNNVIVKTYSKKSGGRALKNLREQYELLSKEAILIEQDSSRFSISLPVILNPNL